MVAVEVAPSPSPGAQDLAALLRACSQALPAGTCETRARLVNRDDVEHAAIALVSWEESGAVLVTVRLKDGERDLTRELTFAPADRTRERWRSVGLAIATIVDELRVQREEAPPPAPVEAAASPAPAPTPVPGSVPPQSSLPAAPPTASPPPGPVVAPGRKSPQSADSDRNALEAGAFIGTGVSSGAMRSGIYARAAHDVANLPIFAHGSVAYSLLSSTSTPSVTWSELALGGGAYFVTATIRAEAELSLQLVRTGALARDPDTGATAYPRGFAAEEARRLLDAGSDP